MLEDGAVSRPLVDLSPYTALDTRVSPSLDPIRLPLKLRERLERAQRRANAAKDGVTIFTKETKDATGLRAMGITTPSALATGHAMSRSLQDVKEVPCALTFNENSDEKLHLPDVVLGHKMRDFEARVNAGSSMATSDRSLQKLSVEDREKVMLAMQRKIRQLAKDVEANFVRLTTTLDANGIFDAKANLQRAQTLCLVDLQRQCKLDRLRDEAMYEVLHVPMSLSRRNHLQTSCVEASHTRSQLWSRVNVQETVGGRATARKQRKRKPVRAPKLSALCHPSETLSEKKQQAANILSSLSSQQDTAIEKNGKSRSRKILSRRNGLLPSSALVLREDIGVNGIANSSVNDGDIYARHPHVAQIMQLLAAGESKIPVNVQVNSAEADMDQARFLEPIEEWMQRSSSYQSVGSRALEAVRKSGEFQRWDTLDHFESPTGVKTISLALRQRLDSQQSTWSNRHVTSRSDDDNEAANVETSISNQQGDQESYAELQNRIREQLRTSERRTRTAATAMRPSGTSNRDRQLLQTVPMKTMVSNSSTVSLPTGTQQQLQAERHSASLQVCASEPVLPVSVAIRKASDPKPLSPSTHSRLDARVQTRGSKVADDSFEFISRHRRRKECLIGAPNADLESHVFGRYSEARIAHRQRSAQTWAWHLPQGATCGKTADSAKAEDEERSKANDHFDEQICTQGDGKEGDDVEDVMDDVDSDLESVDSSLTSYSGHSNMGLVSVKRQSSNGKRRHGKSKRLIPVQSRLSHNVERIGRKSVIDHSLTLQARLDVIWHVLQFPFSTRLAMLERLSSLQDANVFVSVVEHWERITPLVAVHQRMKLAVSKYAEHGVLGTTEWLTPSEFALVATLPTLSNGKSTEAISKTIASLKEETRETSSSVFINWVHDHLDALTLQIQNVASELKAHTGEELQFQGQPYPYHE